MRKALLPDTVEIRSADVPTGQILVRKRQRQIDHDHVRILRNSISEMGKQIVPVALSEQANGNLVLIDGAHRLEAAKQDGRSTVRAEIYTNLTDDLEGLLELVTNRERKDLTPTEILEAWESFDLPLYESKVKAKNQEVAVETLTNRGVFGEVPITRIPGNRESEAPLSIRQMTKESTGYDYDVLVKMRYSHARTLVPDSKVSKARNAFRNTSCVRSSASAGFLVSARAPP